MTPRTEALAYRVWAYATPLGWDVTAGDIAEALSSDDGRVWPQMVGRVLAAKGWQTRVRTSKLDLSAGHTLGSHIDAAGAINDLSGNL